MDDYGLQQLFAKENYLGPAVQEAEKSGLEQQLQRAKMAQQQQETERYGQLTPYEIEKQRLANLTTQAELPGKEAGSTLKQIEARTGLATETESREAARAKLLSSASADHVKRLSDLGHTAGLIGATLQNTPTVLRTSQARQLLQQYGIPENSVPGQYVLKNSPEQLINVSKQISSLSDKYIEEQMKQQEANKRNAATIAGQKELEQMRIDAGKYNKKEQIKGFQDIVNLQLSKAKSARDQHAILVRAATAAQQNGEMGLFQDYMGQAEALRPQAEAEIAAIPKPGSASLGDMNIPVNPTPGIAPPGKSNPNRKPLSEY